MLNELYRFATPWAKATKRQINVNRMLGVAANPSDDPEHPAAEPSDGSYPALVVQGGISGGSTAPGKSAPPERKGTGHPLLRQYPLL